MCNFAALSTTLPPLGRFSGGGSDPVTMEEGGEGRGGMARQRREGEKRIREGRRGYLKEDKVDATLFAKYLKQNKVVFARRRSFALKFEK